jgi:NEDD8-activating enzyme E1
LDTIDISNLNRQFLFRMKDVGRGKAEVAAEFVMQRVPGCQVIPHVGNIKDFSPDFYRQFKIIVCGLDNIDARRWLNGTILGLVSKDETGEYDFNSIIPIIDGGTEGFKGQARVIIPKVTACFECTIDTFPPQVTYQLCTIAETPRIPEHCIAYVFMILWDRVFPNKELNKDSPDDMQWIYEQALARAKEYGIEGVTYFKTIGVVKNVIAAVASTNAVIAAASCNECLKLLSYCSQTMNNYYMYMGADDLFSPTFVHDRKEDCLVCSDAADPIPFQVASTITLREFIRSLAEHPNFQLKNPTITGTTISALYVPSNHEATVANLDKSMNELVVEGEYLYIFDQILVAANKHLMLEINLI